MTTDTEALNTIAQMLCDTDWKTDPGLLSDVASVVRSTGRDVMNQKANIHKKRRTNTPSYDCPRCGARDSGESGGQCHFRIDATYGEIAPSQREDARAAGCRVQHYTDLKTKTEED